MSRRRTLAVAGLLTVLGAAREGSAQEPLGSAMGRCEPDVQVSWPADPGEFDPPYGHVSSRRSTALWFAWTVPPGTPKLDVQYFIDHTDKVEVCRGSGGSIECPWTDQQHFAWKIYDSGFDFHPVAQLDEIGFEGEVSATQRFSVPFDWWQSAAGDEGTFLFIRINDQQDLAGDGFCLASLVLDEAPSGHFRAYGPATTWSYQALDLLNLDPCMDGGHTIDQVPGVCVRPEVVSPFLAYLDDVERWQVDTVLASTVDPHTWQYGSGGDCGDGNAACALHLFVGEGPRQPNAWFGPGQIRLPLTEAQIGEAYGAGWTHPPELHWSMGTAFALGGHELWHGLQHAWNRRLGLVTEQSTPSIYALDGLFIEQSATALGPDISIQQQEVGDNWPLGQPLWVSPSRITSVGREGPFNALLNTPAGRLFKAELGKYRRAALLWRYAMEQFATPTGSLSHPAVGVDNESSLGSDLARPLGHVLRRPDEGVDIFRWVLEAMKASSDQDLGLTHLEILDDVLTTRLGRSLSTVILDFHTALLLKDYQEVDDPTNDARWHLEWIGNVNAGAEGDYFPANPRPADDSTIAAVKAAHHGRLPPQCNVHFPAESPVAGVDRLYRVRRELDSYDTVGCVGDAPRVELPKGASRSSPSLDEAPVVLEPHGMAVLSVHPELTPEPYDLNVHVRGAYAGLPSSLHLRIFVVDEQGWPHPLPACNGLVSPPSVPQQVCVGDWRQRIDIPTPQGTHTTIIAEHNETVPVVADGSVDEVLVVVSAGSAGASFEWSIGPAWPLSKLVWPLESLAEHLGHPASSARPEQPLLVNFVVSDEQQGALGIGPELVSFRLPGCFDPPCELSGADEAVTLRRLSNGRYQAAIDLPDTFFPPAGAGGGVFDLEVEVQGGGEPSYASGAVQVGEEPARTALQLVLDTGETMSEHGGLKAEATRIAAALVIRSLGDEDAVGIVSFGRDGRVDYPLQSFCDPTAANRDLAIGALDGLSGAGCAAPGDGLFEAQSALAEALDGGPVDPWLAQCPPSRQAALVLSDGPATGGYSLGDYYASALAQSPVTDSTDADPACGADPDPSDNGPWYPGELRYQERIAAGLPVPILSGVALGPDAEHGELQALCDSTGNPGTVSILAEPVDGSAEALWRTTVELSDAFRQAASTALGLQRVMAAHTASAWPEDLPLLEVEPGTGELVVSVSSARDDTSVLRLLPPSDAIIAPYQASPEATVFRVSEPLAGTWGWLTVATGGVPEPAGVPVAFVEQAVRSAMVLRASADVLVPFELPAEGGVYESGRYVGADVLLQAEPRDQGPLLGAVVSAEVTRPDGQVVSLVLYDDGRHADGAADDGLYAALFRDTELAGSYDVRLQMLAEVAAGQPPVQRQQRLSVALHHGDDLDADGLPDWWELGYASDLNGLDGASDPDQDGVDNLAELVAHSSPVVADSDGGGEADGSEVGRGADPLDPADDGIGVFQPALAAGNGKVLLAIDLPTALAATVDIQRASALDGEFQSRFQGVLPVDGQMVDLAPNDAEACYRMRVSSAGRTSAWSAPSCVTPGLDPHAPGVELSLAEGAATTTREVTLRIDASDGLPTRDGCHFGEANPFGSWVDPRLVDPELEPSGVSDMLVVTGIETEPPDWQPYAPEVSITLAAQDPAEVQVWVRDGAGHVSEPAQLLVRLLDDWPAETIVAENSIWLRQNSLTAGRVAVLDASSGPFLADQAEVVVGLGTSLLGSLWADSVKVKSGGLVSGDVSYNDLVDNGTIQGALYTPLDLPLSISLAEMPLVSSGSLDVVLAQKQDLSLDAGAYGLVKLKAGTLADPTVLTLTGGVYHLAELDLGDRSRLECAAGCEVRVAGKLLPGQAAYLGPAEGSGLGAADVALLIAGINGSTGNLGATPKAATIGYDNMVVARLFAPNGTLLLKQGTVATGRFVGRDVQVGIAVQVLGDGG